MSASRPRVPLTIAGSDPSGGAGLQADLKVFLRFGLSGAAVPTAWTVQGPSGVESVHALDPASIQAQLAAFLRDVRPAAVKVGMLPSGEAVRVVSRALGPLAAKGIPIVVDPVLSSGGGTRLLPAADVAVFMRLLVPLATVLTPNIDEAAELAGMSTRQVRRETEGVARELLRAGARAVLVKGGHGTGVESIDILGTREEFVVLSLPRVPKRRSVHGTGCALSAALAAGLAQGADLVEAVQVAKQFVHAAIEGARPIGRGARQLDFTAAMDASRPAVDETAGS